MYNCYNKHTKTRSLYIEYNIFWSKFKADLVSDLLMSYKSYKSKRFLWISDELKFKSIARVIFL